MFLVKACPGSGKTATLVARTKALPWWEPKLVLAFNKKAAEEFQSRLGGYPNAEVRTFHSLCLREIMADPYSYGYRRKPRLIQGSMFQNMCTATGAGLKGRSWENSGWDEEFIKRAEHSIYDHDLEEMMITHTPRFTELERAAMENKVNTDPGSSREIQQQLTEDQARRGVYLSCLALLTYRRWLIDNNVITFDSMVRTVASHCGAIITKPTHLMVDEFQDVDRFQLDILIEMAGRSGIRSFMCVGDPNQRIYEWRGALEEAFRDTGIMLPDVCTLPLTTNFRSKPGIIAHAETICNVGMTSINPGPAEDGSVVQFPEDPYATLFGVRKSDEDLSNLAILSRTNRDCGVWFLRLVKAGTPAFLLGKKDFWATAHIRLAKRAWDLDLTFNDLMNTPDWRTMISAKRFRDNEDLERDAIEDARWIMSLSESDMKIMENAIQREDIGVRVSTIHKTKGMEWDAVLVAGVTDRLRKETYVYYVACTRPRHLLVLS